MKRLVDGLRPQAPGDSEGQAGKQGLRRCGARDIPAKDTAASDIRAVEGAPGSDDDSPDLRDQTPAGEAVGTVTANGASDTR